jgi:rare lipoprotein A
MLPDIVCAQDGYVASIPNASKSDSNSDAAALTLRSVDLPASDDTKPSFPGEVSVEDTLMETCPIESTANLGLIALPQADGELLSPFTVAPRAGHNLFESMGALLARTGTDGVDLISFARKKMLPHFATAYRALLERAAMMGLPRIENAAALAHATIIGRISTYNPYRDGREEGGPETASGEPYDPNGWTAAIKSDLRSRFGGVRYGKLYQPVFALVQSGARQLIVKINDVGPLKPGRVLDLNERSMRHFDPLLTRGLLDDARVTLLPGEDWIPGPVGTAYAIDFANADRRALVAHGSDSSTSQTDSEIAPWDMPAAHVPYPNHGGDLLAEVRPSEGG